MRRCFFRLRWGCGVVGWLGFFVPVLAFASPLSNWEWALPVRVGLATCWEYSWVSDLPVTPDTTAFLRQVAVEGLKLPPDHVDEWNNGTAGNFLEWIDALGRKGDGATTLILYFATHQRDDGRTKFSEGPDLPGRALVNVVNKLALQYRAVLFVNDSCHAASLEEEGRFATNVIRLYASSRDEDAVDLRFEKGPYGFEEWMAKDRDVWRAWSKSDPKGLSFLMMMGLKAGNSLQKRDDSVLDLKLLLKEMNRARSEYDDRVRHRGVQQIQIFPENANLPLARRFR